MFSFVKPVKQPICKAFIEFTFRHIPLNFSVYLLNMLAAHARNPYLGERKIVVAMAEMINSQDIQK
ncbi:hypothetical protein [Dolichospermum sp. UHCC 0259]|uniref:hypothetical protein n=1 Tax=Dolichospermum sp. UHCC 0259 TaxID=2590010 RepID=UPI001447BC3C|nr:hypothetical protein [Dolichospermum sp. UHCC 0259]MTJ48122.1 hypothetical protein [Dolichospermum sp. UHCC 0259]